VVNEYVAVKDCLSTLGEKLSGSSKSDFGKFRLYEALNNGETVSELPPNARPFDICMQWGTKHGKENRFFFKRPEDPVQVSFKQSPVQKKESAITTHVFFFHFFFFMLFFCSLL
jgi:hypothetical protein